MGTSQIGRVRFDKLTLNKKLVAIVGPTASGKTKLGVLICKKFNGEIISADSRQVYKGLDIGTGKEGNPKFKVPSSKFKIKNRVGFIKRRARWIEEVPQYLIDIVEPGGERYNLAQFLKDAKLVLQDIWSRGKLPVVVGGTGLYVSGLLRGYELPSKKLGRGKWYKKIPPDFQSLILGIKIPRQELYKKIDERVDRRIKEGMVEEVEGLLKKGVSPDWLIKLGLEYKYITLYIQDNYSKDEMIEKLKFAIHGFARRQLTWLRHQLPGIQWINNETEAEKLVKRFLVKN